MENSCIFVTADTDGLAVTKKDGTYFSKDERAKFIALLNEQFPEYINFADDGFKTRFIVLKTKNYIMQDEDGTVTLKGSSLKSATLEPIMKEFLGKIIDSLLNDRNDFTTIYNSYIKAASNITDIKPYCSKKTISEKTLTSVGTTQVKMRDAIEETDYSEGDKAYFFFKSDDSLELAENFDGDYHKDRIYKRFFDTSARFWDDTNILSKDLFPNYCLVRNRKALEELLNA